MRSALRHCRRVGSASPRTRAMTSITAPATRNRSAAIVNGPKLSIATRIAR